MVSESLFPLGVTAVMLPELPFGAQVSLCASLGVTHYVYRPRIIPDGQRSSPFSNWGNHAFDLTPERLLDEGEALAAELRKAGLTPFSTVPSAHTATPDDELDLHMRGAAKAGCESIRLSPGPYPQSVFDFDAYLKDTIARYRDLVAQAKTHGLKVVIEMHAGNAACSPGLAWAIVSNFDPAELGIILDLPNLAREGFVQPQLAVSVLRDHIDHCHFGGNRRTDGDYDRFGFRKSGSLMCPVTESDLYIPAWLDHLGALERPVPLVIEDYTPEMPGELRLRNSVAAVNNLLKEMRP